MIAYSLIPYVGGIVAYLSVLPPIYAKVAGPTEPPLDCCAAVFCSGCVVCQMKNEVARRRLTGQPIVPLFGVPMMMPPGTMVMPQGMVMAPGQYPVQQGYAPQQQGYMPQQVRSRLPSLCCSAHSPRGWRACSSGLRAAAAGASRPHCSESDRR